MSISKGKAHPENIGVTALPSHQQNKWAGFTN